MEQCENGGDGGDGGALSKRRKVDSWRFSIVARVRPSSSCSATETIGSIAFDSRGEHMASAGIGRKIRVYNLERILEDRDEAHGSLHADLSADCLICTPARLSSILWRRGHPNIIGSGDYDGVVTEWDLSYGVPVLERDEHGGRHVWSIDYSTSEDLCLSSSDEGVARLWAPNMERSAMAVPSPDRRPVCCAEFSPDSSHLIAMACADGGVYVHDLRQALLPIVQLVGRHQRAASYVRFLDQKTLVSASIDSSVAVWDIGSGGFKLESFTSHRNLKNFVGLSVWKQQEQQQQKQQQRLIACGSETNQAFVYRVGGTAAAAAQAQDYNPRRQHDDFDPLVLKHELRAVDLSASTSASSSSSSRTEPAFASAVCWLQEENQSAGPLLAAANSDGLLHILSGNLGASERC